MGKVFAWHVEGFYLHVDMELSQAKLLQDCAIK